MKKLLVVLLFVTTLALSQTTPSPQCASTVTPAGAVAPANSAESNCGLHVIPGSAFYQLGNGKQATETEVRIPLAPRHSLFAAQFFIPQAQGNITVAGYEFRERLGHLFKASTTAKSNFNLNKIDIYGRVGLGTEINSVNNQRSFAYETEGGLEFPIANVAGGSVLKTGVRFGFLGVTHYGAVPEHFVLGSNANFSPTLTLSF